MSDIFDEVSEELRAERAQKLLRKYAGLIFAVALAIVAAAAGWQGWRWWQAREAARISDIYLAALRAADAPPGAERGPAENSLAQVIAEGGTGYRTLARLRAAALKAGAGDTATALGLYDQVAADRAADPLLRDLASLHWALLQIDRGDTAPVAARIGPLAGADHPLRALAAEAQALLALREGRTEAAREILRRLSQDVTAPDGVRGRAGGLLAQTGG